MDDLIKQEIDVILADPDYDQGKLQDWFRRHYGEQWPECWRLYLETGMLAG